VSDNYGRGRRGAPPGFRAGRQGVVGHLRLISPGITGKPQHLA
jgi:hypothetical protein